jgi:hypothetical protein
MTATPPASLQVIGAGFGRTGTTSLKKALEILGLGPCYHMQVTMTRLHHPYFWLRAHAQEPVDYRRFFRRYRSAIDWPACEFYRELMAAFPQARVVLTVRDPARWYDSVAETLRAIGRVFPWWFPPAIARMQDAIIWDGRFGGRFVDRDAAIAAFVAHIEEVQRVVPAARLLVYDVAEGWEPLCRFLDRPVPAQAFPRLNDRDFFRRIMLALRIAEWAVPLAVLAAAALLMAP